MSEDVDIMPNVFGWNAVIGSLLLMVTLQALIIGILHDIYL